MKRKKKVEKAIDIRDRIEHALEDKEWGGLDLSDILDDAVEDDVEAIKPFVPDVMAHPYWVARADALEFVGRFHLREFLPLVKSRLKDRIRLVRDYALTAYYDLLGAEALPRIKKACKAKDVRYRVTAMVLYYIETEDKDTLEKLSRILTRTQCRYTHRYAAMNTFDAYVDVGCHPEIIKLFEAVLPVVMETHRTWGLAKDIPRVLAKWKRSARKKRTPCLEP